jgi:predicted DCC family thiol-disulfide oxidoreductase YuxK
MLVAMTARTLVFYDGLCGLCDRFVRFLLPRDRLGTLRFAALQEALARRELVPLGYDPTDLDTVFVIAEWGTPRQHVLTKSRAILHATANLGGPWSAAARLASMVPATLSDRVYDLIARRRYRLFGKYDACPLPRPEWKDRFVRSDE